MRVIIATSDVRALARYYAARIVVRFPIPSLTMVPQPQPSDADELDVVSATFDDVAELAAIEHAVVGCPRLADYPWLIEHRCRWAVQGLSRNRRSRLSVGTGASATVR